MATLIARGSKTAQRVRQFAMHPRPMGANSLSRAIGGIVAPKLRPARGAGGGTFPDSLLEETQGTSRATTADSEDFSGDAEIPSLLRHRSLSRHLDSAYDDCYKSVTECVTERLGGFLSGLLGR